MRWDEFVFRIVEDPANPPDTLLLVGFAGESHEANSTRLYLDLVLSSYVDVPNEAILHAQPIPDGQSPLGGSYVWVRRDADLVQRARAAYESLAQAEKDYVRDLGTEREGPDWPDLSPGWPDLPGSQ